MAYTCFYSVIGLFDIVPVIPYYILIVLVDTSENNCDISLLRIDYIFII